MNEIARDLSDGLRKVTAPFDRRAAEEALLEAIILAQQGIFPEGSGRPLEPWEEEHESKLLAAIEREIELKARGDWVP